MCTHSISFFSIPHMHICCVMKCMWWNANLFVVIIVAVVLFTCKSILLKGFYSVVGFFFPLFFSFLFDCFLFPHSFLFHLVWWIHLLLACSRFGLVDDVNIDPLQPSILIGFPISLSLSLFLSFPPFLAVLKKLTHSKVHHPDSLCFPHSGNFPPFVESPTVSPWWPSPSLNKVIGSKSQYSNMLFSLSSSPLFYSFQL